MNRPTPPRLPTRLLLCAVLLVAPILSRALDASQQAAAKASCSGQYKPEFEKTLGLSLGQWKDFCSPSAEPPPSKKEPRKNSERIDAVAAQNALQTGNFNALYDRSVTGASDGGSPVVVPQGGAGATLPKGAAPQPGKAATVPPAVDPPLDPKEVAKHFEFQAPDSWISDLPGPLGWLGGLVDDAAVKPVRGLASDPEKAYVKDVLAKLQESAEGRRILRGLINEGVVVKISPEQFEGSPLVKRGDIEEISGLRGQAIPSQRRYSFNAEFMKMKDREMGLESVASNMGHELNHILLHATVENHLAKEGYDDELDYALVDEQSARLKGYLVAFEVNKGKPNGYIQEAREVLSDPDAYWEGMKLWMPAYARALDLNEMKDPVRAYQARLQALTEHRDELEAEPADVALELAKIDHLSSAHGDKDKLTELRALFLSDKATFPRRMQDVKDSIALVTERIKDLQSAKGKPFADKMKQAAADPKFTKLFQSMQDDIKRLAAYNAAKAVPAPKATPGQLGYKAYEIRWNSLHKDAPGKTPPWEEKK